MMRAEIVKETFPSRVGPCFDPLHLPANRRRAEGAWYDLFHAADGRFVVSIGNVAGSPADAASLMLAVRETFDPSSAPAGPKTLLQAADAVLRRQTAAPFATAIIGIVDHADRTFTYVSAGHPPPFIRYHGGAVVALPADGLPIGLAEHDHPPAQVVVDLRDAALLVLYSNMLVQTTKDVADGLRRLEHVLTDERLVHCSSPAAWIAQRMLGDVAHDEVALLAMTFAPSQPGPDLGMAPAAELPHWTASWSFDSTSAASNGARRAFLACLRSKADCGVPVDLAAAELIFGELLGNVVRHAPGPVEIMLDWTQAAPVLHVLDRGPGFRSRRKRERLPVDALSESGRGLFIVNACAAQFSVRNRNGRGTHASATLPPV